MLSASEIEYLEGLIRIRNQELNEYGSCTRQGYNSVAKKHWRTVNKLNRKIRALEKKRNDIGSAWDISE